MTDQVLVSKDGLTFKAYRGGQGTLLAFDVAESLRDDLAGFAIRFRPPKGQWSSIPNLLQFPVSPPPPANDGTVWTSSDLAPIQKFRWVHCPSDLVRGMYRYGVTAMLFDGETSVHAGPTVEASIDVISDSFRRFDFGFTRGYLSSQAYANRFHNAPFRPAGDKTIDYATAPFEKRYAWSGARARELTFEFLEACVADPKSTVDLFCYDIDEPDFVALLQKLGPRLRAFMDDASLHSGPTDLEPKVRDLLIASAGAANVKTGHFQRFAHSKVLIRKRSGKPSKVLAGSANFSVRGLYVQANSVFVFDDASIALLYERAFEQAFTDPKGFSKSDIAAAWFPFGGSGLPTGAAAFSPHASASVSLDPVAHEIAGATSSVLFAVMEMGGSGAVLDGLKAQLASQTVLATGMTQRTDGSLVVHGPGDSKGVLVPFSYLSDHVPEPFHSEWSGGQGQVIHHKFVVVDFNDSDPVVYAGSSNLAAGGEQENGDNLVAFRDRSIASAYAVEAVRLIDHYRFRAAMMKATTAEPLRLRTRSEKWWTSAFDPTRIQFRERLLFVR